MKKLRFNPSADVDKHFKSYPPEIKPYMVALRKLILQTASQTEGVTTLTESLKWGEPSYRSNLGSTVRMDWKAKTPEVYALYFQCSSRLVETFRSLFPSTFTFEGNRAILFRPQENIPEEKLTYCLRAALTYHKVKHLPTLGI